MSLPALPVKVEADYEHSNGYGEPPAKRPNTGPSGAPVPSASRNQANPSSSSGSVDANVTLWQFLLDLLLKQQYSNIICWTNNEGEFKLLDAEQVAKLWGLKKNKNNMNYDKLSRALRYYYDKNIIKKVMGQKFVYKFVSFPEMVKTENRIPFKKKMESIVNDSNPAAATTSSATMSSFSTLRPYDVKSGLIQQAQLAATALAQQQQLLHQHAVAQAQVAQAAQAAMVETKYQIPAEHRALYHNSDNSQPKLSPGEADHQQMPARNQSRSPTPNISSNIPGSQHSAAHLNPQTQPPPPAAGHHSPHHHTVTADRHTPVPTPPQQANHTLQAAPPLSPPQTPVSVCTPAGSPSANPVFELPGSGTPTPPPKPLTPVQHREAEVKVKLEIPEFDDNRNCETAVNGSIGERRNSKQSKLKPDPLSISNDVVVNQSVTSPLMTRGILPSLNTPMFLTSPMFGQRTPLIPGIHFWGPGTLSPVATLSPRFGSGLHAAPAFQFPAFAVSPATLASFSTFHDSVFTSAAASGSSSNGDKKLS